MNEREAILLLSHLPTVSPSHLAPLKDIGLSISDFVECPREALRLESKFWNQALIQQIEDIKTNFPISKIIDDCESKKVTFLTFIDPSYPKFLAGFSQGILVVEAHCGVACDGRPK